MFSYRCLTGLPHRYEIANSPRVAVNLCRGGYSRRTIFRKPTKSPNIRKKPKVVMIFDIQKTLIYALVQKLRFVFKLMIKAWSPVGPLCGLKPFDWLRVLWIEHQFENESKSINLGGFEFIIDAAANDVNGDNRKTGCVRFLRRDKNAFHFAGEKIGGLQATGDALTSGTWLNGLIVRPVSWPPESGQSVEP